MTTQTFSTTLARLGSRTVIRLPFNPDDVWGKKERHHVNGSVNGAAWRGPLTVENGQFILSLGPGWLRDNTLKAGAVVKVSLAPEGPQSENIAPDISAALAAESQAAAYFASLPTFYRKNFMRWIEGAKRAETRQARLQEMLALLKDGKRQR